MYNEQNNEVSKKSVKRWTLGVVGIIILIFVLFSAGSLVEDVDADKIIVNQVPISGTLNFWTEPGLEFQKFGNTTVYEKAFQFWFSVDKDRGEDRDQSIEIIFNDAGKGRLSGSARLLMPRDERSLRLIQSEFGSMNAVKLELIRETINKVVFSTGPLMSSYESYAVKKNDLINYIKDQLKNGIYKTITRDVKTIDPLSGKEKTVQLAELVPDPKSPGGYARQEDAPFKTYGIRVAAISVDKIIYEERIINQIAEQQKALMQVKTAIAKSKEAEQEAIKVEAEGKAKAVKAKWDQEIIKAKAVTAAEQKRDVAKLEKIAAEYEKQKQILLGQGEAERKKLVMLADGALKQKLEAYVEVNKMYAKAISDYKGNWVPATVFGSRASSGGGYNGAQNLIDLFTVKTANDLHLQAKPTK